jgi:translocation and assembly module TamB
MKMTGLFWRPKHLRAFLTGILLFAAFLGAAYLYLTSQAFQLELQTRLIQYLERTISGTVRLAGFRFDPLLGSVELTGLSIARQDMPDKPFLDIAQANVGFSLLSPFEERILSLRSVSLHKPQLKLEYLAGGNSPVTGTGKGQSSVNFVETLFRIAIDHLAVADGRMFLKSESIPLELDLHALRLALQLDRNLLHYEGELEFQDGTLAIRSWKVAQLALRTRLKFYSQGVELSSGHVHLASSSIGFSGLIANLYSPDLWLDIAAQGKAEDIQDLFGRDLGIQGPFLSTGRLTLSAGHLKMLGRLSSPEIAYWRLTPRNVQADFLLNTSGMELNSASFDLLGGQGKGQVIMRWGGGDFSGSGTFQVSGLDARIGLSTLLELQLPVSSVIGGQVSLDWSTARARLTAQAEASLRPGIRQGLSASSALSSLPVGGKAAVSYSGGRFLFDRTVLEIPGGTLLASGWISLEQQASLQLNYHGENLDTASRQLGLLIRMKEGTVDSWLEGTRSGAVEFTGSFEGVHSPHPILGHLKISRPVWEKLVLDLAQADMTWNRDRLGFTNLRLNKGEATINGSLAILLSNQNGDRGALDLQGSLDRLALPVVMEMLEKDLPIRGFAGGSFAFRGIFPQLDGTADMAIQQAAFLGQSFDQIKARLTIKSGVVRLEHLEGPAGLPQIAAEGWYDPSRGVYSIRASGTGWDLKALTQDGPLAGGGVQGIFEIAGQGEGTLENPFFTGTLAARQVQLNTLAIDTIQAQFRFGSRKLHVSASTNLGGGKVALDGTTEWTESRPSLTAELMVDSVDPLLLRPDLVAASTSRLAAPLSGSISVTGPLTQPEQWNARMRFPNARLKFGDIEFLNQAAFEPRYQDQKIIFDPIEFAGNQNRFSLSGEITVAPKINLNLRISSTLTLDLFNTMTRGAVLGGTAALSVNLQGDPGDPRVFGSCRLDRASINFKDSNYSLTGLSGLISFNEHLAGISELKGFLSGGGQVTLNGTVNLDRLTIKDFVLQAKVEQALLRIPQGFRTLSNADLVLRGNLKSQVLMGQVGVADAVYSRNVDFLAQIAAFASDAGSMKPEASMLDNLSLNLVVNFENGVVIKTETVRLSADSTLHILGPATRPSLLGRISATSGEVFFFGNRYEITRGGVEFVNPVRIEPQFDLEARTTVKGYRINLLLRGTPANIQPEFRSEPPLPVLDLITLLSTGATSSELSGDPSKGSSNLGMTASNLLAGELAQQVETRVQRALGFSQFKIDPLISQRSSNPTARVTVERRFNNNLSVTYSTDITTSKTQIVVLEYYLTPDYSLVASRDENGRFGLDLRIQRKF